MNTNMTPFSPTPISIAIAGVRGFVNIEQFNQVGDDELLKGLEWLADILGFLPDTGAIDLSKKWIVLRGGETAYLHYKTAGADYYISERDPGDEQWKAFGMVDTGLSPFGKMDFICLRELLRAGAELDLSWVPKPMTAVQLKFVDVLDT